MADDPASARDADGPLGADVVTDEISRLLALHSRAVRRLVGAFEAGKAISADISAKERALEKLRTQQTTVSENLARLAASQEELWQSFKKMNDPRENFEREHWNALGAIRDNEQSIERDQTQLTKTAQEIQRLEADLKGAREAEVGNKERIDHFHIRMFELEEELTGKGLDQEVVVSMRTRAGRVEIERNTKKLDELTRNVRRQLRRNDRDVRTSWYLKNRTNTLVNRRSYPSWFSGLIEDSKALEGDQREIFVDRVIGVLRVVAEDRPDLLLSFATQAIEAVASEPARPRVLAAVSELLGTLAAQARDADMPDLPRPGETANDK